MITILTQNRERIIDCKNIRIINNEICELNDNGCNIKCILGEYNSKEECLEVLNKIFINDYNHFIMPLKG